MWDKFIGDLRANTWATHAAEVLHRMHPTQSPTKANVSKARACEQSKQREFHRLEVVSDKRHE